MKYFKDPKIITIVVLVISIIVGGIFTQKKITEITDYHRTQISTLDSTYHVDSLAMIHKYMSLDSSYAVAVHERDSLVRRDSVHTTSAKVLVRTIYKDSIKEVYTENTEYISVTQSVITTQRDSIAKSQKQIEELNTQITDLKKDLALKKTDTVRVDSTVTKIVEPADKKFSVYANVFGKSTQSLGLSAGAEIGGDYKILSPLYIGASIRKDGIEPSAGYNAIIRAGVKMEF